MLVPRGPAPAAALPYVGQNRTPGDCFQGGSAALVRTGAQASRRSRLSLFSVRSQTRHQPSELGSKYLILWSHPPGLNRRPADYESTTHRK